MNECWKTLTCEWRIVLRLFYFILMLTIWFEANVKSIERVFVFVLDISLALILCFVNSETVSYVETKHETRIRKQIAEFEKTNNYKNMRI